MLRDLAKVSADAICAGSTKAMRGKPAYYILWWVGNPSLLGKAINNFEEQPSHKSNAKGILNPNCQLPEKASEIPLYTGFTPNLSRQISAHMKLGIQGRVMDKTNKVSLKNKHPLRVGLETLFPDEQNPKQLIFKHVGMTYAFAHDVNHSESESQLTRKLQATFQPLFNGDI